MTLTTGTLALVGSGEYLPPMTLVDEELLRRLAAPAQVVCLPTGAGTEGEARIQYWCDLGVQHFTRLGARAEAVKVIDRASAEDERLSSKIRAANFVYLSGGKPAYLHNTLKGTRAWAAIEAVLAKGGVVAGCSAGAMIFGERFPNYPVPWPWVSAFNYLPGVVIMPHFDEVPESFVAGLRLMLGKSVLVGIEGNTALVVDAQQRQVFGRGGVEVWKGANKTRYLHEQVVVWPK